MATEALKSKQITDMDATPRVPVNARLARSPMQVAKATIETVLAISQVGSTYRMVRIPANAMIHAVYLSTDDLGTTGDVEVGVYLPNGGAVVDANFFASAVDANAAVVLRADVTHEATTYGIQDVEKPLWDALGKTLAFSADYDFVIGITEDTTAAGTITLEVHYTQ